MRHNLWIPGRQWLIALGIVSALLVCSNVLFAQDSRGKLTIRVVDTQGAIVPNAELNLVRDSTRTGSTAKSDASGTHIFQYLEPDTYTLHVSAPTLNPATVNSIVVQAYGSSSIDVTLKPATANAEVTVTSEPALLQTESASRAYNIEQKEVTDLPVINGNPVMLGNTVPGVYMRPLGIYTDPWTVTSQYQINGGLIGLNEFQIDGSPNDAEMGLDTYAYTPPQYAVKEFTVSANNYDAQYGHTSGGVINLTTMSGTDRLHGMFWSSLRRTGWNANTYQNKYQNAIHNVTTNTTPFNSQTQLGFQVGGPLRLPKVIPSSNRYKPFFFFAFDHYTELLPRGLLLSYPTAKMRTGDFSELLNDPTGYQPIVIADPSTTHLDNDPTHKGTTYGHYIRDPFPGNIIPANRINPIALKIAQLLPDVGSTPSGQRIGTKNLSLPNNYYNWHFHNLLGRFDFNIGDKYKFFVRPFYDVFTEVSNAGAIVGPGENGGQFSRTSKGFLFDFVDVINPTTVLNARYGYTFFRVRWGSSANQNYDLASLGYPANFISQLQQPDLFGQYAFQNYSPLGWFDNVEDTGTYSIEGNLSKVIGQHNVRVGWDVRLTHFTFINPGSFTFTSNSNYTATDFTTGTASEATSGDSFATFLLGTPSSGSATIATPEIVSTWYLAPWIQDDWRVTPHLTFNLGLRYDVLTGPVDKHNALDVGFDPNVPNAVQSQMSASALPQGSSLTGGLQFANVNGNPRSPLATVYHNIQPRFGFAWQPFNKLVVRGGYGLFYTNFQNNNMLNQTGFSSATPLVTSNDGGQTTIPNVLSNPFPNGLIQPTGSSLGTLTGIGQGVSTFNRNYKIPSAHEFSFGFQYRVTHSGLFEAAYVGNNVRGYAMAYDANLPSWSFLQTCDELYATGHTSNCSAQSANPFKGVAAFKGTNDYTASTIDQLDLHRPHPEFLGVSTGGLNGSYSWYNGLQLNYTQRMTHGVAFNVGYVWSKQIEQSGWLNQALNIYQHSVYRFGLPKVFKVSGVFQLPIGRGRLINLRGNRIADAIVGGWEFDPSLSLESGEPAGLPTNAIELPHNRFLKPDWTKSQVQGWNNCVLSKANGVVSIPGGNTGATAQRCGLDLSKYDWEIVPVLPNEQANPSNSSVLRMKPVLLSDAAVQKSFHIREGVTATIRLQASNVLNHFNLLTARFDTNPNDGANFGTVIQGQTPSADSPPRNLNVQFRATF